MKIEFDIFESEIKETDEQQWDRIHFNRMWKENIERELSIKFQRLGINY